MKMSLRSWMKTKKPEVRVKPLPKGPKDQHVCFLFFQVAQICYGFGGFQVACFGGVLELGPPLWTPTYSGQVQPSGMRIYQGGPGQNNHFLQNKFIFYFNAKNVVFSLGRKKKTEPNFSKRVRHQQLPEWSVLWDSSNEADWSPHILKIFWNTVEKNIPPWKKTKLFLETLCNV